MAAWYEIANADEVASPALLVYPDRVRRNLRKVIEIVGDIERLRPHVKTHKMAEVIKLQMAEGISKFKCSTLAETEMVASCGAKDILLAYPQVGPNSERLARLAAAYPQVRFSTIVEDASLVEQLAAACRKHNTSVELMIDINNGMNRTGIAPGEAAIALYGQIVATEGVEPGGLHVYDGHIRDLDLADRIKTVEKAFEPVDAMWAELKKRGWPVPRVTCGGTPTFPVHARRQDVECSPGTFVFWDHNYGTRLPDLPLEPAAVLMVRVVSKPGDDRMCLDAGYKAVSPDYPNPRLVLIDVPDVTVVNHSEEHLTVSTPAASKYKVGDVLYGIPWHVCPTVALHRDVVVVENGRAVGRWKVAARDRMLTY